MKGTSDLNYTTLAFKQQNRIQTRNQTVTTTVATIEKLKFRVSA